MSINRDICIDLFEKGYERYGIGWEEIDEKWGFKNKKEQNHLAA